MSDTETDRERADRAEDDATFAEVSYSLLARAYRSLAVEMERREPGSFSEVNRKVMVAVVDDLLAIAKEDPQGVVEGGFAPGYGIVAGRLRTTLFDAEVAACAGPHRH